jgi:hypothetical protein
MRKHIPIETGTRVGKLTVIARSAERIGDKYIAYDCACDCGNITRLAAENLRSGRAKSCGCIRYHPPTPAGKPDQPWRIPLWSRGAVTAYAIVDPEDGPEVAALNWTMDGNGRAYRWKKLGPGSRNGINVMMHREILGLVHGDGKEVDHINCKPLDNRRGNLRLVTHPQNLQNRNPAGQSNGRAGVRGVSWDSWTGKWRAVVTCNGKTHHLGRYASKEAAAAVASAFRREHLPYSAGDQATNTSA